MKLKINARAGAGRGLKAKWLGQSAERKGKMERVVIRWTFIGEVQWGERKH